MFSLKRKTRKTSATASRPVTRAAGTAPSRPITHERWIPVQDLQLGMYVSELSVPWEDTGFMFQGFNIDSMKLLKQVANSCDEVLIRSEKMAYASRTAAHQM